MQAFCSLAHQLDHRHSAAPLSDTAHPPPGRVFALLQDGAPQHTSADGTAARVRLQIPTLVTPPAADDLNPADHVIRQFKRIARQHVFTAACSSSDAALEAELRALWVGQGLDQLGRVVMNQFPAALRNIQVRGHVSTTA